MKNNISITSIIYIFLGLCMIISPESISNIICYVIGFIVLGFAFNQIMIFIKMPQSTLSKFNLVLGIIAIMFGGFIIINPQSFISFIPFLAGIVIIIDAVTKIVEAINLKQNGYSKWNVVLITAIIMLIFGLFLFFNSFRAIKIVIMIIGLFLIIDGICQLLTLKAFKEDNKIIEAKIIK